MHQVSTNTALTELWEDYSLIYLTYMLKEIEISLFYALFYTTILCRKATYKAQATLSRLKMVSLQSLRDALGVRIAQLSHFRRGRKHQSRTSLFIEYYFSLPYFHTHSLPHKHFSLFRKQKQYPFTPLCQYDYLRIPYT